MATGVPARDGGHGPERLIQEALEAAGDPAGAFLWRRVCRDLDGDLRVGVVSRDEGVNARAMRDLRAVGLERVEWVPVRVEGDGDGLAPTLGAIDRLLSVHALVWATPATAPLGAEERAGMEAIVSAGAPADRVVLVADESLVAQMADDPDAELGEVVARVRSLCGEGWAVERVATVAPFVERLAADRVGVTRARRRAVAQVLLRDALARADHAVLTASAEVERVRSLLDAEDARLDAERRKGRRAAAHLLGAMRRQTELLLMDLRSFLHRLEADLPAQVEAVPSVVTLRHTLPHWLHHVVERWMADRLAAWRGAVLTDLAELELAESDLDRAELLVPALHTAPVRSERGWGQRLGVTAAVGGGAALVAFGMWIPGLLAVTTGIAWSAFGRRAAQASTRRGLVDAATEAVRQMGQDADRLLRDQIKSLEDELERLGDHRAGDLAAARAEQRAALQKEFDVRSQRLDGLREARDALAGRIATMEAS